MTPETLKSAQPVSVTALGWAFTALFVLTVLLCIALAAVIPDEGLHTPWLQFFPWFEWSLQGVVIAVLEAILYAWFVAIVFGTAYNYAAGRSGA